ncbi:MAG: hypothetical protein HFI07_00340 [Lachnospiraceae bacterium]|nr:hypothetical protein [Lachnospiraceae bacterium]
MKKIFLKHLSGGILILFFALLCSMPVFAKTVSGNDPELVTGGVMRAASGTTTWEAEKDGVTFKVTYPSDISCGESVAFEFETVDDSGQLMADVKYRIHSLMVYDGAEYVSVYDVSYGQNSAYKPDTAWNFTFYASGKYYIRFNALVSGKSMDTGSFDRGIVLNINDPSYPSVEEIVEEVAGTCLTQCATDFDKALWLNDWLVDNCSYDNTLSFCSAEGALARGEGTCEAYHRAYVMLLNKAGIATGRITGNGHVWTAVKLDGKWYQVDTTWNDAGYEDPNVDLQRLYFGLNDTITSMVHSEHKPVPGYESNSLENNYFIKTGKIAKWAEPQIQAVQKHIDAGETSFSLEIKNTYYADVLYSLVAHVLTNTSWSANGHKVDLKAEYRPNYLDNGNIDEQNGTILCQVQDNADTGENGSNGGNGSSDGSGNGGGNGSSGGSGNGGGNGSSGGSGNGGGNGSSGGSGSSSGNGGWTGSLSEDGRIIKNGRWGVTVYGGVEYAPVFNFDYYVSRYADIRMAFGNNEQAVLDHFINYGMMEGRSAQADFNVYFYRNSYPDLEDAFGDDLKSYFYHYLNYGIKEGRKGIPQ